MFKKQVKCTECGFLAMERPEPHSLKELRILKEFGWPEHDECPQEARNKIADCTHMAPEMVTCIRHAWDRFFMKEKTRVEVLHNLNSRRKCALFFPYNPGFFPIEHKELQREAKTQSLLIKGMILAAVIGALIGALITVLINVLSPGGVPVIPSP